METEHNSWWKFHLRYFTAALFFLLSSSFSHLAFSQSLSLDRERGVEMLSLIKSEIKRNYYDPAFHAVDLDARFKAAAEKIKQAGSNGQVFAIIAQAVLDLDDSHTFFLPPGRASRTEYGWQMQMIGNKCFVVAVKPKSDAEAKGLKPGDEIYSIDGFEPTRDNLWKIQYAYYTLRPRPGVRLVVQAPDGKQRELEIAAKIEQRKRVLDLTGEGSESGFDIGEFEREEENQAHFNRHRFVQVGDAFIWKMPQFDLSDGEVDDMMSKVAKHKSLILDLRGNGGGLVSMLVRLAGYFFEQDTRIGDPKGRKELKPMLAKTRGERAFKGQLVVLVDNRSASASELFARLIQLQKRGTVIGDRSSGAVMMSRVYEHQLGQDTVIPYGVSVTAADIIMADGKSLEKTGVVPDEGVLPTATDLAGNKDPALARAAALVRVELSPEKAGSLFPIEWRP